MLDRSEIKRLAAEAGFDLCGLAPCRPLEANAAWFRKWLARGYQSTLGYLERNVEKRFDPSRLFEGAQTAVVCAVSYKNPAGDGYPPHHRAKVASYASTADYHDTIRAMLRRLLDALCAGRPALRGRAVVDSAPLAEKQLAVEAGLGWIGRQSLLVTPRFGTYVLLGELLLTEPADSYDTPFGENRCGSCRACLDACPAAALVADRTVDTRRCISRHTVERDPDPAAALHGWIFGCDACQSCCPYNRRAPLHTNPTFDPLFDPVAMEPEEWLTMTPEAFDRRMGSTPLTRSGLERIRQNIRNACPTADDE